MNLKPQFETAWKLKLKNQYQIKTLLGQGTDFDLDIYLKRPDGTETNSINNIRLLELFGFDKFNEAFYPVADGKFDYRPGITFRPQTNEIIFPVLEPFGNNIPNLLNQYKYQAIYDTLKSYLNAPGNNFIIRGTFKLL